MTALEKFSLKWGEFSNNLRFTFAELRTDQDLLDVTLSCEDGTHIEAHKVVLTAGSLFFSKIYIENKEKRNSNYLYERFEKLNSDFECGLSVSWRSEY